MARMDEHEAHSIFRDLAGGEHKASALVRIYNSAVNTASGNGFTLRKLPTADELFRKHAKQGGFPDAAVEHYLNHIA